jgi:predicted O-methyltransferase YrrM
MSKRFTKIHKLYEKYANEIIELKPIWRKRKEHIKEVAFDDIEAELLYMYVREIKPDRIIEFAPDRGWSTHHILDALNKNNNGKCVSYDIVNEAQVCLQKANVNTERWEFVQGDVSVNFNTWDYDKIDMVFIDCDHSSQFALNYTNNALKKFIERDITVFIHDIFHDWKCGEQPVVINFLLLNNVDWISPSKLLTTRSKYDEIRQKNLGSWAIDKIHEPDMNPVIIINP